MAFTLRITFSGLCLFVPEPVGGGTGRMHVLMPGMFGHHHGPEDRHVPVVVYDAGALVQGGPSLGVPALAKLTGYTLTLGQGDTAGMSLCSQIVDLAEITGRSVDPDHLGPDSKRKLTARVTLRAGAITRVAPGVCWEMRPGEFRPIAHRVEWEIPDFPGDSLALVGQPLSGGGAAREMGTLYPRNGLLSIEVLHETPQELPPEPLPLEHHPLPTPGEHPKHFSAFYTLFGEPVPIVLPRFWGTLEDAPAMTGGCPEIPPDAGAYAYTCLVAGAGTGGGGA
ncbi:MAG TPA: hypothetical protein VHG91_04900 [Longimicrobium sp.]|nr:hypothetical protein [Longimicrobium sp.]